ncbi:hypothetical protein CZP2022_38 [Vibrio phage C-ZP2022]|nr:hypothetical protein CZP2022_38 [Vibrio phage C-ZP2022]
MKLGSRAYTDQLKVFFDYQEVANILIKSDSAATIASLGKDWPSYVILFHPETNIPLSVINGEYLAAGCLSARPMDDSEWATFTEEQVMEHAKKNRSIRTHLQVCKACYEKDGTLKRQSDFDGEVILRCPSCRGEKTISVLRPYKSILAEVKANSTLMRRVDVKQVS